MFDKQKRDIKSHTTPKKLPKNNTSGYRGVSFKKQTGRWEASISVEGEYYHVGYFDSAEEAARVRDKIVRGLKMDEEIKRRYYPLNFPEE